MSFKIIKNNCCGLDVHKTWIFACIGITDSNNRTEYKQARFSSFTKGLNQLCDWLAKYNCKDVCMESTGKYWIPVFNILEHHNLWVTLSHPKYTKPMKGNKTDRKDAKWICDLYMCGMVKPSFIPTADIRELRDLVRYRYKLTCMITGEKNRAQNCLTVSNLKLDEVFSDVFGKSSRSITEQILQHPGEAFDVAHFVHGRCKTPIEEIQAAVDGAISKEQEILRLSDKYETALNLIRTVPGFDKNPLTAKLSTTTSSGGLILALQRAITTARPEGRYRKHCYWLRYKAVLLESSLLESSACSLMYFCTASSVILPIVST
ncbi:MAG: IS110 family transposase [Pilosibacter sp.]